MNKQTFVWILECALLSWDEVPKEKMIKMGADPREIEAGIRLCNYIKEIKIPQEIQ